MKIFTKKCVVCEKKVKNGIEKHDQNFCSEECVEEFEGKMKDLEKMSLDDCC